MTNTEYKFYSILKRKKNVLSSKIPETVLKSVNFNQLLKGNILNSEKAGRGRRYFIVNEEAYLSFYNTNFNHEFLKNNSRINNTLLYRNSKATKTISNKVFFLRGFCEIKLNNFNINLNNHTTKYGLFAFSGIKDLVAEKLCFVENLECFFNAEKIIGNEYVFIHKYGRIGVNDFKTFSTDDLLIFNDFDLIGLDEFLKIKEQNPHAKLFIPDNFKLVFEKFSVPIKPGSQNLSERVKISKDANVKMIRNLVLNENRILEQEALFNKYI